MDCLGEAKGKSKVCGPLGAQLMALPVIRGWMCSPPQNWMTVGSGRLIKKIKSVYKKDTSQDWRDILGEEFISFSSTSPLLYPYSCPVCEELI